MTLAAWLHQIDPWVVRLGPDWGVRWYGLSYVAGFVAAWLILRMLAKRRVLAIAPDRVEEAIVACIIGVLAGGRLAYCVFYEPHLLTDFSDRFPWWGLLQINRGGMASHGGMVGVIVATWYIASRLVEPELLHAAQRGGLPTRGRRVLHACDAMALAVPPGLFMGRVANFINGELLGRVVEPPPVMGGGPGPWWAVRFPQELADEYLRDAGKLTDRPSSLDDGAWIRLDGVLRDAGLRTPGVAFEDALARAIERAQSGGSSLARQLEPFVAARVPSQLLQALAEGLVLGAVLWVVARRPRLPGVVGCWFLMVYGVLRVVTEIWRLPDPQLAVQRFAGLSRGQWLSVVMVVVGLVALRLITRRGGVAVGGWARRADAAPAAANVP